MKAENEAFSEVICAALDRKVTQRWINGISVRCFEPRVPDQNHTLLTGDYGTPGFDMEHNTYATAAKTADGTFGVVYTPVQHTLAIAMNNFSGPVTAQWYDPTNGAYQTVAGLPFPNSDSHDFTSPENNSAGDPDWILLLQAALGSPTPTPAATFNSTPTATATATATFTPTPMPTATHTPTPTTSATPRPSPTPRSIASPRPRPTPAPRP